MKTLCLIIIVEAIVLTYGLPTPGDRGRDRNMMTGVFIPADTLNNLQGHTNSNQNAQSPPNTDLDNKGPNGQSPSTAFQSTNQQPNNQQHSYYQHPGNYRPASQDPALTNQLINNPQPANRNPSNLQPIVPNQHNRIERNTDPNSRNSQTLVLANQPSGQPIVLVQQPSTQQPNGQPNQQIVYMQQPNGHNRPLLFVQQPSSQQPNGQPNQPIVLVQQPSQNQKPNQPIYLVQQPGHNNQQQILVQPNQQPIYLQQPNQQPLYLTQPNGQPTQVVIGTSNGNQFVVKPVQNQPGNQDGVLYTLVPLNGQNSNTNSGWTLVPVQSATSKPIVLSDRQ